MKDLIEKVFNDKMSDGSFESIISKKLEEMISSICYDLTSRSSDLRNQAQSKLEPIMLQAFEQSNFEKMTLKLTAIINEGLKETALDRYSRLLNDLHDLFGGNTCVSTLKDVKSIPLSTLFEKYQNYVRYELSSADHYFDDDQFYVDEDGKKSMEFDCYCTVNEESKRYFYTKPGYEVEFACETGCEKLSVDIRFRLYWNYDNTELHIMSDFREMRLADLRHCPDFILYLWAIENQYIKIEIDGYELKETVDVEFSY